MTDNDKTKDDILRKIFKSQQGLFWHGALLAMEQYHLARLEAITPEIIDKHFPIDDNTFKNYHFYAKANLDKREAIKWLINKLKQ